MLIGVQTFTALHRVNSQMQLDLEKNIVIIATKTGCARTGCDFGNAGKEPN